MSFQLNAADKWLERAQKTGDVYAQFLLYFTGFNALFFLWGKIDGIVHDPDQITNLLKKFGENMAQQILDQSKTSLDYFLRREPVARMKTRTCQRLEGYDKSQGQKWKKQLDRNQSAVKRLVALGQIVYLVRCNLIHGSKVPEEDTETVSSCLGPLKLVLENSIAYTTTRVTIAHSSRGE